MAGADSDDTSLHQPDDFPCPQCGHLQTCPCASCQRRRPTEKPWVWVKGDLIQCGGCGLTQHVDWWQDMEIDFYNVRKREGG
jgi:transcription elongation factor Elf1